MHTSPPAITKPQAKNTALSHIVNLDEMGLVSEADQLMQSGKIEEAIYLYKTWLEHKTSHTLLFALYFNLGVCLRRDNKLLEANSYFSKALAENPQFDLARTAIWRNQIALNNCNNFGESWINIPFEFECEIHHCFPRDGGSATAFKVLNIATEPTPWCISSEALRAIADKFDLILTYRSELLDLPNARFMVFGNCTITGKPVIKRFEVSFLYSVGLNNNMTGYALRKTIWESRKRLPPTFKYYSSKIRPPLENDNPWIHDSKDALFESMFSVIIENSSESSYFTEKIIDAFQTYTIPIYWGCPNISDFFDSKGILFINSVAELEQLLLELTAEDYYSRYWSIAENYVRSCKYSDILLNIRNEINDAYHART